MREGAAQLGAGASVVLLTMAGPEHRYVAERFADVLGASLKAVVLADAPRQPLSRRVRRYWRRYSLRQIASRVYAHAWSVCQGRPARKESTLRRIFGQSGPGMLEGRADLIRCVPDHNGPECQHLVQELAPDILAVYGTAIIRPPMIGLSAWTLNMHTGISPRYRGSDSVFWALHNEEPEWVGVTIHVLDAGIDSGPIVTTGCPSLSPDDDEDSLFAKCVVKGTELYLDAIRAVGEGRLEFRQQELEAGRQYRFVDRTVAAERRVKKLLASGLLHHAGEP